MTFEQAVIEHIKTRWGLTTREAQTRYNAYCVMRDIVGIVEDERNAERIDYDRGGPR